MNKLPVIIPFYKHQEQLDKCVEHLKKQSLPVEIFVRDNTYDNVYFTAAVNDGLMRFVEGDNRYILILNQDMYLESDAVHELVRFMEDTPLCGIAAPVQLHPEKENFVSCGGTLDAFPNGRHVGGPLENFKHPMQSHWVNGACMMLRTEMVREIGILDRNMRFIGSDSDYCFTARTRGWQVWVVPSARGVHDHGASGASGNPEIEKIKLQDMIYFAGKWLTDELYRAVSYEGAKLSSDEISEAVAGMKSAYDGLVERFPSKDEE